MVAEQRIGCQTRARNWAAGESAAGPADARLWPPPSARPYGSGQFVAAVARRPLRAPSLEQVSDFTHYFATKTTPPPPPPPLVGGDSGAGRLVRSMAAVMVMVV